MFELFQKIGENGPMILLFITIINLSTKSIILSIEYSIICLLFIEYNCFGVSDLNLELVPAAKIIPMIILYLI